jgi:hypothetical protein
MKMQQPNEANATPWSRAQAGLALPTRRFRSLQGLQISRALTHLTTLLPVVMLFLVVVPARAQQDEHKKKVPIVDKITDANPQEAFSGSIQSLDLKNSLLQVHSTADNTDEYFPVKKTVHVANAAGERVTIDYLKPGVNVLVYYEQKGDRRAVKEIVVLGAASDTSKSKSTPPS